MVQQRGGSDRGAWGWAAVGFLGAVALYATVRHGFWPAVLLFGLEVAHPWLGPFWAFLTGAVDDARDWLAPFKRFPGALLGIVLLFVGLALGLYAPGSVAWLGGGVAASVSFIAQAAPYVIFFTLTPSIVSTIRSGGAGRFALEVNVAYVLTTVLAGLLAAILVVPIFGLPIVGGGASGDASGGSRDLLELAFSSTAFIAIFVAVGLALMMHGFRLEGLNDAVGFVGGKVIELLGDLLKILLPLILLALGVFIPTRVSTAVDRAREAGELDGVGWAGQLDASTAYFAAVGVMVALLAVWLVGFAVAVVRYTKFSMRAFFKDYFLDVYAYAWATASSSATIPINLERAGSGLKVRRSVREFIIPLGATVNLDGTMIGGIVTACVASQMVGYAPSFLDLLYLLVPLTIITIGVPGVPGGLAIVAAPIMVDLLPLPPGTGAAFTAVFVGFNLGLSDMFRTGVNSCDNGLLARFFEYRYDRAYARKGVADVSASASPTASSG